MNNDISLQISGIQHFIFCRRQWGLIYVDEIWADNYLTKQGSIMHENAHQGLLTEKRGDLLITRSLPVSSRELRIHGICDVVEFRQSGKGIPIPGYAEKWLPCPVEYKRGVPKPGDEDVMQLVAQAVALEEMLSFPIDNGAIYYGRQHHRMLVPIDTVKREELRKICLEMHDCFKRAYVPRVRFTAKCNACSIKDLCLPKQTGVDSTGRYFEEHIS